jgi:hypothetical protein
MLRRVLFSLVVVASVVVAIAGCGTLSITPPPRFLEVEDFSDSYKAVTPEDSRLWARVFNDDDMGDLAFWQDALKEDLTKNRGYVLVSEADTSAGGVKGREVVLETTVNGRPVRELLALFVTPAGIPFLTEHHHVHVIEYVADKDRFDAELTAVRAAVASYQP